MNIEKKIAKYFGLKSYHNWLRHANPYSVFSRLIILLFFVISIWSRVWIGWYFLIPFALLVIWTFVNPLFFSEVGEIRTWWSKCVIGEYLWSNRDRVKVQKYHYNMIYILTVLQSISGITLIIGLYKFSLCLTLLGTISLYLSKMWFLDRMVWIYEELKGQIEDVKK